MKSTISSTDTPASNNNNMTIDSIDATINELHSTDPKVSDSPLYVAIENFIEEKNLLSPAKHDEMVEGLAKILRVSPMVVARAFEGRHRSLATNYAAAGPNGIETYVQKAKRRSACGTAADMAFFSAVLGGTGTFVAVDPFNHAATYDNPAKDQAVMIITALGCLTTTLMGLYTTYKAITQPAALDYRQLEYREQIKAFVMQFEKNPDVKIAKVPHEHDKSVQCGYCRSSFNAAHDHCPNCGGSRAEATAFPALGAPVAMHG